MSQYIKPRVPVIDWSNPLSRGLLFDVPMFEGGNLNPIDLVSRRKMTSNSGVSWIKSLFGNTQLYNLTTGKSSMTSAAFQNSPSAITLLFIANPSSVNQGSGGRLFVKGSTSYIEIFFSTTQMTVQAPWSTTGEQSVFSLSGFYDRPHIFLLTYSGVVGDHFALYIDGAPITRVSGTNSTGTRNADDANIYLGNRAPDTNRGFNGSIQLARYWNRVFRIPEIISMTKNPLQIYTRITAK